MNSHHRNSISVIEEWLTNGSDLIYSEEEENDLVLDHLPLYGIYPAQDAALLYTDETVCQEEK